MPVIWLVYYSMASHGAVRRNHRRAMVILRVSKISKVCRTKSMDPMIIIGHLSAMQSVASPYLMFFVGFLKSHVSVRSYLSYIPERKEVSLVNLNFKIAIPPIH